MIVQCPECKAQYNYPDERFGDRAVKKLRCYRCSAIFEAMKPGPGEAQLAAAPAEPEPAERALTPGETALAEHAAASEELMEITLRRKERAIAEELPDDPPPPTKKRRRTTSPGIQMSDLDTGKADGSPKLPEGYRLSLAVINGPDSGKVYRIEKPRIVIGRTEADIDLSDPEASGNHAAIEVRESIVLLEDLGSTNGTFHKGKTVETPLSLHNHSEFQVGNTTLMLIVTRE